MMNKKNISRMYSRITPKESSVEKCLDCMQTEKIARFPMKRVLLVAACITLLMAMLVTAVGATKLFNAYDALDEYSKTLPYSEKQGTDNSLLNQNSAVASGGKITAEAQGLKITAQEIIFDGSLVCISFVGEYNGEYKDAFCFDYNDTEDGSEFLVEGENVRPLYASSFYVLKTEDKFSGMLRLPFGGEKDEVSVDINIPYLQVSDEEDNALGSIYGDFSFNLTAKKSKDVLSYTGEGISDEVYIKEIVSSAAGLKLTYFVPDSMVLKASDSQPLVSGEKSNRANIQPQITDENGNWVKLIEGRNEDAEGGKYHIWRCEATTASVLNVILYDKNDIDGCGETPCVVAELSDIILK